MIRKSIILTICLISLLNLTGCIQPEIKFRAIVETEGIVYNYESADNGANPMWCFGNTCIVRYGEKVFASGIETIEDAQPMNNVRWMLFEHQKDGWQLLLKDTLDRTREPCPLGLFSDGRLFLSTNPSLTEPDVYNGPAQPGILQFSAQNPDSSYKTILPLWDGQDNFTGHSYRSFAIDGINNEILLLQNDGYTHAEWSFYDKNGLWSKQGQLVWPWGDTYTEPQAIRICYPVVQLKDRAVHFLGVSDIVEPNKIWQEYKYELTGRKWDYDFRRLFYISSSDITTGELGKWIEIASREKTAGHIFPCDLWIDPDGLVHILWTERALDERLQEKFFPEEKQSYALNYAILNDGEIIFQEPIMLVTEDEESMLPGKGRFHVTPDNRLFVFYNVYENDENGIETLENRLVEIEEGNKISKPLKLDMQWPLSTFYTANIRSGSSPSEILDVYGRDTTLSMRYARIRLVLE